MDGTDTHGLHRHNGVARDPVLEVGWPFTLFLPPLNLPPFPVSTSKPATSIPCPLPPPKKIISSQSGTKHRLHCSLVAFRTKVQSMSALSSPTAPGFSQSPPPFAALRSHLWTLGPRPSFMLSPPDLMKIAFAK